MLAIMYTPLNNNQHAMPKSCAEGRINVCLWRSIISCLDADRAGLYFRHVLATPIDEISPRIASGCQYASPRRRHAIICDMFSSVSAVACDDFNATFDSH